MTVPANGKMGGADGPERDPRPSGVRRALAAARGGPSLAAALAGAPMALVLVDAGGTVVHAVGAAVAELLGAAVSPVGRSALEAAREVRFVPHDRAASISGEVALRRALAGDGLAGLAYAVGRVFETRLSAQVEAHGGVSVLVVALDVTTRERERERSLCDDRIAAMGTLAAGIIDEINNPLTYTLANIEYVVRRLRAPAAPTEAANGSGCSGAVPDCLRALSDAVNGAERIRRLARDALIFARGGAGPRHVVDVRAILESALQLSWHSLRERARVERRLGAVPPVEASEADLGLLFSNLLANAVQALPEGNAEREEVRVTTRLDAHGDVLVEVADSGCGIAPDVLARVFDPFFTTRARGEGMGLGLAICHGIVRHLGGELTVESTPGNGAAFRAVFPPADGWRGRVLEAAAPPRPRAVLVVDADALVADAIGRLLGEEADVTVAVGAREGVRLLQRRPFDLVLCDLALPESSGIEFFVAVLRLAPEMAHRVVFTAGAVKTRRVESFLGSMKNVCVERPFDAAVLRRLLANVSSC